MPLTWVLALLSRPHCSWTTRPSVWSFRRCGQRHSKGVGDAGLLTFGPAARYPRPLGQARSCGFQAGERLQFQTDLGRCGRRSARTRRGGGGGGPLPQTGLFRPLLAKSVDSSALSVRSESWECARESVDGVGGPAISARRARGEQSPPPAGKWSLFVSLNTDS